MAMPSSFCPRPRKNIWPPPSLSLCSTVCVSDSRDTGTVGERFFWPRPIALQRCSAPSPSSVAGTPAPCLLWSSNIKHMRRNSLIFPHYSWPPLWDDTAPCYIGEAGLFGTPCNLRSEVILGSDGQSRSSALPRIYQDSDTMDNQRSHHDQDSHVTLQRRWGPAHTHSGCRLESIRQQSWKLLNNIVKVSIFMAVVNTNTLHTIYAPVYIF